jgi:hypothetical protein
MVACTIMALVVAALAVLADAVQLGAEYGDGHGQAVQHARVTLERITRVANKATANAYLPSDPRYFPGLLVVTSLEGEDEYPDALVAWNPGAAQGKPSAAPVDPNGLPRFNELVIFCPRAGHPNELIELTAPTDARVVPAYGDQAAWLAEIEALKNSATTHKVTLTNLVRTASTDGSGSVGSWRACVRFNVRLRPTAEDLAVYEAQAPGDRDEAWKELPWAQNIYSPSVGLRQVWLRVELQLLAGKPPADGASVQQPIPFFDSAAVYYSLEK